MSLKYQVFLTNSQCIFFLRCCGLFDHDHAILLSSWFDDDVAGSNIAVHESFFIERDATSSNERTVQFSLDQGAMRVDRVLAFELAIDRNVKVAASNFAKDFGGLDKYHLARALDRAAKNSLDDEIMALDHYALHRAFFLDVDIAAGLDATVPVFVDFVVSQTDVGTAGKTM